jgi:hypothetical protein
MLDLSAFKELLLAREDSNSETPAYRPEVNDLYFLYCLVREKAVVSILEFGSGWSTLALSIALQENLIDFGEAHLRSIRHPNPFQLLTLDASEKWQGIALARLTKDERLLVSPKVVTPTLSQFDGVLCHFNDYVPNFTPDLIYLDGPDHDQVTGVESGFKYDERFTPPMSGDLLKIEPYLWPETIIVADGRTSNVRFLESRFKRNWQVMHDPFGDRSLFRINEPAFGIISEEHINFRLTQSRLLQDKENPQR